MKMKVLQIGNLSLGINHAIDDDGALIDIRPQSIIFSTDIKSP